MFLELCAAASDLIPVTVKSRTKIKHPLYKVSIVRLSVEIHIACCSRKNSCLALQIFRSSHQRCSIKTSVLKNFKIQSKALVSESLF